MENEQMFKAGDRVHHIGRKDDGTVLPFDTTGVVRVEFDNPTPRGNRSVGEFDEVSPNRHRERDVSDDKLAWILTGLIVAGALSLATLLGFEITWKLMVLITGTGFLTEVAYKFYRTPRS